MRYVADIESPPSPTTQDTTGQPTGTWTVQDRRRVSIEPLRARERFELQQVHGTVDHRLLMQRYEGLKPQWRIRVGSRYFVIKSPPLQHGDLTTLTEVLVEEVIE